MAADQISRDVGLNRLQPHPVSGRSRGARGTQNSPAPRGADAGPDPETVRARRGGRYGFGNFEQA